MERLEGEGSGSDCGEDDGSDCGDDSGCADGLGLTGDSGCPVASDVAGGGISVLGAG